MFTPKAHKILPILFFLALLSLVKPCFSQPPLAVGALIPSTGRWVDAGRECSRGMVDAAKWLNEHGGIQGRRLEISIADDTSQPADIIAAYRKLNESDKVFLLYIYSNDTAQALLPHIQFSRIPTLVGSLPSHLANPSKYPCLFSIVASPLDLARIAITFISEKSGMYLRRPKLAFIGSSDYLDRHFLEQAKNYANAAGLELLYDVTFTDLSSSRELPSTEKTAKQTMGIVSSIRQANADFAYLSVNSKEASSIIREARRMGVKTRWICNSRAFDETLAPLEGVLGVQPISFFGEKVPGMAGIIEAHQAWHPDDTHTLFYVEGWATVQMMVEALRRSLPEQRLSRERVRGALESLDNYVLGGLIPPVTITRNDHRPSMESRILVVKDGRISIQSSFISVLRDKKYLQ